MAEIIKECKICSHQIACNDDLYNRMLMAFCVGDYFFYASKIIESLDGFHFERDENLFRIKLKKAKNMNLVFFHEPELMQIVEDKHELEMGESQIYVAGE